MSAFVLGHRSVCATRGPCIEYFTGSAGDAIGVFLQGNDIDYVFAYVAGISGSFMCFTTECAGVTISPPDDDSARTVIFPGTVLPDLNDPTHTMTLTGGPTRALPQ